MANTKYEEIRHQIKSGDAIFFKANYKNRTLWDKLQIFAIQLFTLSKYTHCGFVVRLGDRLMLCDMTKSRGCSLSPLSEAGDFIIESAPREMKRATGEWVLKQLGHLRYSVPEAIEGGLGILGASHDSESMCAELLRDMLFMDGYENLPKIVTPESLREWCANGWGGARKAPESILKE